MNPGDCAGQEECACDPIVRCACGLSLDDAKVEGVWVMGGIACEYRHCSCGSHRPFMARDVIEAVECEIYDAPETSEVSASFDSFLDALMTTPANADSTIMRRGVVLARAFAACASSLGWRVETPVREREINASFFRKVTR